MRLSKSILVISVIFLLVTPVAYAASIGNNNSGSASASDSTSTGGEGGTGGDASYTDESISYTAPSFSAVQLNGYPNCKMVLTETTETGDSILEVYRPVVPENCPENYVKMVGRRIGVFAQKTELDDVEQRLQEQINKVNELVVVLGEEQNETGTRLGN